MVRDESQPPPSSSQYGGAPPYTAYPQPYNAYNNAGSGSNGQQDPSGYYNNTYYNYANSTSPYYAAPPPPPPPPSSSTSSAYNNYANTSYPPPYHTAVTPSYANSQHYDASGSSYNNPQFASTPLSASSTTTTTTGYAGGYGATAPPMTPTSASASGQYNNAYAQTNYVPPDSDVEAYKHHRLDGSDDDGSGFTKALCCARGGDIDLERSIFVRNVLSIVCAQLLLVAAIAAFFYLYQPMRSLVVRHSFVMWIVLLVLEIVLLIVLFATRKHRIYGPISLFFFTIASGMNAQRSATH
jgi:hypothetical protein